MGRGGKKKGVHSPGPYRLTGKKRKGEGRGKRVPEKQRRGREKKKEGNNVSFRELDC